MFSVLSHYLQFLERIYSFVITSSSTYSTCCTILSPVYAFYSTTYPPYSVWLSSFSLAFVVVEELAVVEYISSLSRHSMTVGGGGRGVGFIPLLLSLAFCNSIPMEFFQLIAVSFFKNCDHISRLRRTRQTIWS